MSLALRAARSCVQAARLVLAACVFCGLGAYAQGTPQPNSLVEAEAAIAAGHYSAAESICRASLRANPANRPVSQSLALALYLQGKDTEAIALLRQVVSRNPDQKAWALMASSYCRLGQYGPATLALHKLKPWPKDDALLTQVAPCVLFAGAPFDGPEVYELLVERKVEPQPEYAVGLARAYIHASKTILGRLRTLPNNKPYVDAADAARRSLSAEQTSEFVLATKAFPAIHSGMSLEQMALSLEQHPDSPAALFALGAIAGDRGVQAYEDVQKRFPDSVALLLFQAELLTSMDRVEDAAAAYRDILRAYPDTPNLHFLLGALFRSVHRWDEALAEFRAQAVLFPDDERVMEAIEGCLQGAGRFAESYAYLQPLLAGTNVPEWALQDFAVAAKNTGHLEESMGALQRAERMDPADVSNHYRLFALYQQLHEPGKATSELQQFNRLKKAEEAETTRQLQQRKQ